jgi:hypothetical protein
MKESKTPGSEFRNVHAAKETLAAYIQTNRNTQVFRTLDLNTDRLDVWLAVFEKEPEALRILMEKELYALLLPYSNPKTNVHETLGTLCMVELTRTVETKASPLTLQAALGIVFDVMGNEFKPILLQAAEKAVARRQKIVAPYTKKDNEWVNYAQTVLTAIKELD